MMSIQKNQRKKSGESRGNMLRHLSCLGSAAQPGAAVGLLGLALNLASIMLTVQYKFGATKNNSW